MRIVLEGRAGYGDVIVFGKNWGSFLRSAFTFKGRSTKFRSSLELGNALSAEVKLPGPVDARVFGELLADGTASLDLKIVLDGTETVVWSASRVTSAAPRKIAMSIGKLYLRGEIRLEA